MREYDLVEPHLEVEGQTFVVSLQHRSVFSEADRRWIAGYESFSVERDEEKVLLLGRGGGYLTVNQIMQTLGLVDTEDYRQLVERLLRKGLIEGARRTKSGQKARNAPRWRVVQPREANTHLGDLLRAAQNSFRDDGYERSDYDEVMRRLPLDSPYRQRVKDCMLTLGLVDPSGVPTGALRSLLEAAGIASDLNYPSRRAGEHGLDVPARPTPDVADPLSAAHAAKIPNEARSERKIYVENLAFGTTEDSVRAFFERVGEVRKVDLPPDVSGERVNRGYGFVVMEGAGATRALAELAGNVLDGRPVRVEWARSGVPDA